MENQLNISKRAQRQNLINEVREKLEQNIDQQEIISSYDQNQHSFIQKLISQINDNSKLNSKEIPLQLPPKQPKIDKFLKSKIPEKDVILQLKQQITELKNDNQALQNQLKSLKTQHSPPNQLLNKITLALQLHEYEAKSIAQIYSESKQFEPIAPNSPSQKEMENQNQIQDIEILIQKQKCQLELPLSKPQKLQLNLYITALTHQLSTLKNLQFTLIARTEQQQIHIKNYKNLTVFNQFKTFNLPCFYPTFPLQQHPLRSNFPIQFPPSQPQFLLLRKLGQGGFSTVFKAFNLQKTHFSALKISDFAKETTKKLSQREAKIHSQLLHENVVKVHQILLLETEIAIEMEICSGNSLYEFICLNVRKRVSGSQLEAISIIQQVLSAVAYLHANGVIHNDISLNNILSQENTWKLADFTLAKDEIYAESAITTLGMTQAFAAPERFRRVFSSKSDVYSVGVVCFLLLTGYIDFFNKIGKMLQFGSQSVEIGQLARNYFQVHGSAVFESGEELREVICRMLDEDSGKRPEAAEVLKELEGVVKGLSGGKKKKIR